MTAIDVPSPSAASGWSPGTSWISAPSAPEWNATSPAAGPPFVADRARSYDVDWWVDDQILAELADRLEGVASPVATFLFLLIVVGAVASEWTTLIDNLPTLGPAVLLLNVIMLGIGYGSGLLFKLGRARSSTIAVEIGIQNATLGITIGALLAPDVAGLAVYSLPSGVYGILMYVVSLPAIAWLRVQADKEASELTVRPEVA